MRIRKRLPPSSPLSDPQLNRSPVVQQTSLQLHPNGNIRVQEAKNGSQPSDPRTQPPLRPLPPDQQTIIAGERSKRILISDHELKIKQKQGEKERSTEKQDQENGSNNPRKECILLGIAIADTEFLPPSSSHQVDERWYEGDKAIPLKKRRGSFLGRMGEETIMLEKEKKMKPKMKSKTNKKCSSVLQNSDEQDKEMYSTTTTTTNNSVVKKMNKRGSVIMEGSRCSRVNGRGWRCCQQTLVGYSLCEHHLGKGRLRSITSVRSRAMGVSITTSTIAPQPQRDIKFERLSSLSSSSSSLVQSGRDEEILLDDSYDDDDDDDDDNDDDYDDDDEKRKKLVLVRKKRMKLGMVKARSLSSLLNQTNNAVVVAAGDDWNNSN